MYDYPTYLIAMIIVLLGTLGAQLLVKSRYKKYSAVLNARGMTGCEAARRILTSAGLTNVPIERVTGELTDHFDPKANILRLSDAVYDTPSIAAVGIAAHEAGHAIQYAGGYTPIRIRSALAPVTGFASKFAVWICVIGLAVSLLPVAEFGAVLFGVVVLFELVTLPVEFNASSRALSLLTDTGVLSGDEVSGARKVLSAAALTYVAALASAVVQLLRLLAMVSGGKGKRRR